MPLLGLIGLFEAQSFGDGSGLQYATAAAAAGLALAAGVAVYNNTMAKRVPPGLKPAPMAPGAHFLLGHLPLLTRTGEARACLRTRHPLCTFREMSTVLTWFFLCRCASDTHPVG
jgi:hypothetical protein